MSLDKELAKIIRKNEGKIVSLVKQRLFNFGVDGDGKKITPDYSLGTIRSKKEKGQRTSHVTLRDEGLFYKGFYIRMDKYDVILSSTDDKTSFLLDKYGQAILQFTSQEQNYIINEIVDVELERLIQAGQRNSQSAGSIELDLF